MHIRGPPRGAARDAGDQRVLKTAVDAEENERHTAYVFETLELRRAAFSDGDYTRNDWTEVPYLFANGVRLARVVWHQGATASLPELTDDDVESGLHVLLELGDHLGSTSTVLDLATGELVEKTSFYGYGATESDYRPGRWGAFREDYRFTGKEEDTEVGLTYFGKRYLNAQLGRWVSADPLGVQGFGADANLYAYVRGALLKNIDPLGLQDDGSSGPGNTPDPTSYHEAPRPPERANPTPAAPDVAGAGGTSSDDSTASYEGTSASGESLPYGESCDGCTTVTEVATPVGDVMDFAMVVDPKSTTTERVVGGTSLVLGAGFLPNLVGPGWRAATAGARGATGEAAEVSAKEAARLAAELDAAAEQTVEALRTSNAAESGIVYRRTDPKTGEGYVGKAKSPSRFDARQGEHDRALGVQHEYEILGTAEPGLPLDVLEESKIREMGGLQKEGGSLANRRHEMRQERYESAGGRVPAPKKK